VKRIPLVALVIGPLAVGAFAFAQEDVPTFRSGAQLALTGFHVVAKKQYITGLTAADFQLLVDGKPHPITVFESNRSDLPIDLVLLFDVSGSVTGRGLLDDKLFRENLLADLPGVTLSVYYFGGPPKGDLVRMCGPTQDPVALARAFQGVVKKGPGEQVFDLGKPGKNSLIYESIERALQDSARPGSNAIQMMLAVSDGEPGGDREPTAAANAAQRAGVPVYPLVVGHQARISEFELSNEAPPRLNESEHDTEVRANYRRKTFEEEEALAASFASLGDLTGGRAFDPPDLNGGSARDVIRSIADAVRNEYVAGFAPEPGNPPVEHRIEIRLIGHKEARLTGGSREAVY